MGEIILIVHETLGRYVSFPRNLARWVATLSLFEDVCLLLVQEIGDVNLLHILAG